MRPFLGRERQCGCRLVLPSVLRWRRLGSADSPHPRSHCFASEGEKSHFAPPGAICAAAVLTWHARSFAPLASAMGATPPPAHLPERRACSCEGPKKAHRNLVGLRRTASRSPRSVLSARASSRSFITAIGVGRRDFTVWTGRQRALVAPGRPCPAPYAGWSPSLPKRIGRTEVRSPRPFRALVALAGRNLPPLCSPPRRRAGLSAMAQIERAYANQSMPIYSPLEHMGGVRCLLTPQPLLP